MNLKSLLGRNSPVEVKQGNGYIEVLPNRLTKETYLSCILKQVHSLAKQNVESFLYIGTDLTDDSVFSYIKTVVDLDKQYGMQDYSEQVQNRQVVFSSNCKASICVMGKRPSSAPYYLEQRDLGLLL